MPTKVIQSVGKTTEFFWTGGSYISAIHPYEVEVPSVSDVKQLEIELMRLKGRLDEVVEIFKSLKYQLDHLNKAHRNEHNELQKNMNDRLDEFLLNLMEESSKRFDIHGDKS